jgi:AMP-polyphosphate phosphotransferase
MLSQLNLDQKLSKEEYKRRLPLLQRRLYVLEQAVFQAKMPVMIVFEGWAAAGKGTVINQLAAELDARGFRVVPIHAPRTAEQRFPWMRRFWLQIPGRGQMVAFDTSWYRRVLIDRVTKNVRKREWLQAYEDIQEFEAMLAADGMVFIKFWLQISKKEQGKRFKKLRADKLTAWQVSDEDAAQHEAYGKYQRAVEEMLARTEAPHAPWTIVEATDREFTALKVIETIVRTLEARLGDKAPPPEPEEEPAAEAVAAEAEPAEPAGMVMAAEPDAGVPQPEAAAVSANGNTENVSTGTEDQDA